MAVGKFALKSLKQQGKNKVNFEVNFSKKTRKKHPQGKLLSALKR